MENPASIADLAKRGYVGDDEVAATRLDEAWRALQAEVPTVPARLDQSDLSQDVVVDVLCSAALRVLRNDSRYTEGTGAQDLYFTAAEKLRVAPPYPVPTAGSLKYS